MTTFLTILLGLLVIGIIGGGVMYVRARKLLREQKNYERGLKTVPLLIHLPPLSEDIEGGGRDARDLNEENISKAQVMYNLIASTAVKKGMKSGLYGQRHFGFEIVAHNGFVQFYAAVPMALLDVVKQAVVSAYPTARLEEVAEHNIFSPVGKISGTVGGELVLKENYAYPIATYQELKRDTIQSLLNSMSTLGKEDGAGVQILLRPANTVWRKNAQAQASKLRKGDEGSKGGAAAFGFVRDIVSAIGKAPEAKDKSDKDKKELSSTDQAIIESIEEKTRHPGYEVLIRVVASSDNMARSQTALNNIVSSFSLFESQGRNGFKYVPAKDIESFVTGYILRFFPQESKETILNGVELASLFHFPDQKNIPTTQLERQASKQVDGPRNLGEDGLVLGYNLFRGIKKKITLSPNDRRRHMYIVGQTGTGKSTFLENLALQDMQNGDGFAYIDPHGDTAEKLLSMVPKERAEDVVYFSPADMDYPLGLNLFEYDNVDQKDFLIQEAINMLYKLYDPQHQGIIGPRYEHWFRNAALTLMSDPDGSTFIDIPKVFTDNKYAKQKLKFVKDPTVLDFWNKEMAQTSDYHKSEVLGWFVSKFGAFLSNEMMRNIIGQTKSSFNLREIMDNKKILLVNLSKGRAGELNSKLLGMIFVMKFQAAAMSRANVPEEQRPDFSLYVDEFQNFSTDSFATILSEARKYHLNLIVANQFTTQLTDEIRDAVFGNVGSIVSFRVGTNDAEFLAKQFAPVFDSDDLQRVPNANTVVRLLIGGIPSQAFSMATLEPMSGANKELGDAIKQLSAAKYGRPKGLVEKEIFERLRTIEEPKPAFGNLPPGGAKGALAPPPKSSGSSFLDEWLSKRKQPVPAQLGPKPFNAPAAGAQIAATPGVPTAPAPAAPLAPPTPVPAVTPAPPATPMMAAPAPHAQPVHHTPSVSDVFAQAGGAGGPIEPGQTPAPAPKPVSQPLPEPAPEAMPMPPTHPAPASNEEANEIADELRNSLKHETPVAPNAAAVPTPALTNTSTEGTMHLRAAHPDHTSGQIPEEDTIFIDQDGNLHSQGDAR